MAWRAELPQQLGKPFDVPRALEAFDCYLLIMGALGVFFAFTETLRGAGIFVS